MSDGAALATLPMEIIEAIRGLEEHVLGGLIPDPQVEIARVREFASPDPRPGLPTVPERDGVGLLAAVPGLLAGRGLLLPSGTTDAAFSLWQACDRA